MGDGTGLRFGPFHLLAAQGPLLRDGQELRLQPKTLRLLWTLARQPDVVVTKAMLLDAVWPQQVVTETALSFQIQLLRSALGDDPRSPRYIATVHRVGFRFVGAVATASQHDSEVKLLTPLVGRSAELAALQDAWSKAQAGQRQVIFISGEAGIGKTALIERFAGQVRTAGTALVGRGQCVDYSGHSEAYLPILEALDGLCRLEQGDRVVERFGRDAPGWLAEMTTLLDRPERERLRSLAGGSTPLSRQRELAEALEQLSLEHPLLLSLEDLHWADSPTIDFLQLLARRKSPARLLLVCSYRPVDAIIARHAVNELKRALTAEGHAIERALGHLRDSDTADYLAQRYPDRVDLQRQAKGLHQRTEGLPLFVVRMVDALSASADVDIEQLMPSSLQELIQMQAASLSPEEQETLDAACVEGQEFTTASVAAALGIDIGLVERRCDRMARLGHFVEDRGLAVWPDGTAGGQYAFRHALYQVALYRQLGAGRRRQLHHAIATRLEAGFAERAHEIAADLARHYEAAHLPEPSARFHQLAAENNLQRYAPQQAAVHLERAIALLPASTDQQPPSSQAITLHLQLGAALCASRGYTASAVYTAFSTAESLACKAGDDGARAPALWGLFLYRAIRAEFPAAQELAEQLIRLAERHPADHLLALQAHLACGTVRLFSGDLQAARLHLERGLDFCDLPLSQFSTMLHAQDLRVDCAATAAWLFWLLDMPDRAIQLAAQAASLASERKSASSHSLALYRRAVLEYLLDDPDAGAHARELLAYAHDQGLPHWEAAAVILQVATLPATEVTDDELRRMRQAIGQRRAMGVGLGGTLDLLLLARTLGRRGDVSEALDTIAETHDVIARTGERLWLAAVQLTAQALKDELRRKTPAGTAALPD